MNRTSSIVITFYFMNFKSSMWVEWLDSQANYIAENMGMKISPFDYRRNDTEVTKNGFRYSKRNILYFEDNNSKIEYLSFDCLNKGEQPFDSKLTFTVRYQSESTD